MRKYLCKRILMFMVVFAIMLGNVSSVFAEETTKQLKETWEVNTDIGPKVIDFSPESLHEYNKQLINGVTTIEEASMYKNCWAIIHTTNHGAVYVYDDCTVPGAGSYYVRLLQCCLNDLGYNAGKADGIYGPNTQEAIKRFQRANKLTVDGVAGEMTWRYLDIRCDDKLSDINF